MTVLEREQKKIKTFLIFRATHGTLYNNIKRTSLFLLKHCVHPPWQRGGLAACYHADKF